MSVEFVRESPGKLDSRTLSRKTHSRWTGRTPEPLLPFEPTPEPFVPCSFVYYYWSFVYYVFDYLVGIPHVSRDNVGREIGRIPFFKVLHFDILGNFR